ncbi:MAG: hypothetical protein JWM34_284 [Ilumatobacteraceae bacterium]|nr:hypothetical protein [Ilumatobacteraceae bacterium]
MRLMISTLAIGAGCSLALALAIAPGTPSFARAPGDAATVCAPVPYSWAGTTTLAPGASFSTGMTVPTEVGVQLAVGAFDVSTVDPAPGAIALSIGGGPVSNGAPVSGGEIAATNASASPVVVTRVELSLDRCYQVDSAAPAPTTDAAAVPSPTMPPVPPGGLPATGQASEHVFGLAMILSGLGLGLLLLGRRRSAQLS